MTQSKARIVEVFSSLQGEGVDLGQRQIFVRFGGCNLCCDYCDEPETIPLSSGRIWDTDRLKARILALNKAGRHGAISWTGGEPLLHADFLRGMMLWARSNGFKNYLETNGILPERFKVLAKLVDVVAMDVKLPSATGRQTWPAHEKFLLVAPGKTFIKVVLTESSTEAEWGRVVSLIKESAPEVPLILQPATAVSSVRPIPPARALAFLDQARQVLKDVRLIPQWHPVWGVP